MTAASLVAGFAVVLVGASMCVTPAMTRPTVQFGVRVPPEHVGADVIRRERRAYYWRTAIVAAVVTAAALLFADRTPWLIVVLLPLEIAAGLGCFLLTRDRVAAVKSAEGWYAGQAQAAATDTTLRTDPERFPLWWLLPALVVLAATVVIGIVRYRQLPDRLAVHFSISGHPDRFADTSVWNAFSLVSVQVLIMALIVGLLVATFRGRPDIDVADPAASTRRYRTFLSGMARGLLVLAALVNLSLLMLSLQMWELWHLTGGGALLPMLPIAIGAVAVVVFAARMGQGGFRLDDAGPAASTGAVNRDDDRWWKGGLIYVNRDDPAVMVTKRFGVGWTLNLGNPKALIAIVAFAVVVAAIAVTATVSTVGR